MHDGVGRCWIQSSHCCYLCQLLTVCSSDVDQLLTEGKWRFQTGQIKFGYVDITVLILIGQPASSQRRNKVPIP